MNLVPAELRRQVIFRAGDRCEYCGLAQEGQEATFHIDHIFQVESPLDSGHPRRGSCSRATSAAPLILLLMPATREHG